MKAAQLQRPATALVISVPAYEDKQRLATAGFFRALHGLQSVGGWYLSAEIIASSQALEFTLVVPQGQQTAVRQLILAYWPACLVAETSLPVIKTACPPLIIGFRPERSSQPATITNPVGNCDPLAYLTAALGQLESEEYIVYQLLLQPVDWPYWKGQRTGWAAIGQKCMQALGGLASLTLAARASSASTKVQNLESAAPEFKASLRLLIAARSPAAAATYQATLVAALGLLSVGDQFSLRAEVLTGSAVAPDFWQRCWSRQTPTFNLKPPAVADLYHWPAFDTSQVDLPRFWSRTLPLAKTLSRQTPARDPRRQSALRYQSARRAAL